MTMMDFQKTFDKVAIHLRKQGKAATVGAGCMYRTDEGLKCAVGCLIPDELYDARIEGVAFKIGSKFPDNPGNEIVALLMSLTGVSTREERNFLAELQVAHDEALLDGGLDAWREEMESIAERYALSFSALHDPLEQLEQRA